MATTASTTDTTERSPLLERPAPHIIAGAVAPERERWTSWFTTTDHKKIGIMYLYTCLVFFVLGGVEALLIRIQLQGPDADAWRGRAGGPRGPGRAKEEEGAGPGKPTEGEPDR